MTHVCFPFLPPVPRLDLAAIAAELGETVAMTRHRPKTKIMCTLSPTSRSIEMISRLLRTGMSVARFNFSHGSHEYHQETLDNLRAAIDRTGILCTVMLNTKVNPPPLPPSIDSGARSAIRSIGFFVFVPTPPHSARSHRPYNVVVRGQAHGQGLITPMHLFQVFFMLMAMGRVITDAGSLMFDLAVGETAIEIQIHRGHVHEAAPGGLGSHRQEDGRKPIEA